MNRFQIFPCKYYIFLRNAIFFYTLRESISRGYPFFCKKRSQVYYFILDYLYTLSP